MNKKIVLASHNPGKIKEFQELLKPLGIEVLSAADLKLSEPEETGETFAENAILKAEAATQETGLPAVADDSGLCIDALNGAPGVYSKRYAYAKGHKEIYDRVLEELSGVADTERGAHFICSIAYSCSDRETTVFEGRVDGTILSTPTGKQGFGYDPVFQPEGCNKSFAEMSQDKKNSMSHRGKALQSFLDYFKNNEI